jgi:hypothetical protein
VLIEFNDSQSAQQMVDFWLETTVCDIPTRKQPTIRGRHVLCQLSEHKELKKYNYFMCNTENNNNNVNNSLNENINSKIGGVERNHHSDGHNNGHGSTKQLALAANHQSVNIDDHELRGRSAVLLVSNLNERVRTDCLYSSQSSLTFVLLLILIIFYILFV